MIKKPLAILGISPGSKYLGISIFQGSDLSYWGIKVLKGVWSKEKIKKAKKILSNLIDRHDVNVVAIKKLHPSRSSKNLNRFVTIIKEFSKEKRLKVCQYSLKDLKNFFSLGLKMNKRQMAELIVTQYPFLEHQFEKEKRNKNPYFIRMFEAIALGTFCFHQLDH